MTYVLEKSYNNRRMSETCIYDENRRRYVILYVYDYEKLRENTYAINRSRDNNLKKSRLIFFVDHVDLDSRLRYSGAAHYIDAIYDLLKGRESDRSKWTEQISVIQDYIIQEYALTYHDVKRPYIIRIRPNNPIINILESISERYSILLDKIDADQEARRERLKSRERREKERYIRIMADMERNRIFGNIMNTLGLSLISASILSGFIGTDHTYVGLGFYAGINLISFRSLQRVIYPISHQIAHLDRSSNRYYRNILHIVFDYIERNRNGDVYVHIYGPENLKRFVNQELKERIKNIKSYRNT